MPPLQLFYSYSHRDEVYRDELAKHLKLLERKGILTSWHDRRISPGDGWKGRIEDNLKSADIILLLVSPDFIASDYCYDVELKHAMQRHNSGIARVIPVIVRSVNWHDAPFGGLQVLPFDGKPVSTWENQDAAWADVEKGIRVVISEITQSINAYRPIPSEPSKEDGVSDVSDVERGRASKTQAHSFTDTETREIELTIDADFDKYTEQDKEQLLNAIASLLKIKDSELKIKKIRRGSIKITLEMPAELAEQLYGAVQAGKLKQLGVTKVELKVHAAPHIDSEHPEEPIREGIDELFVDTYKELERLARRQLRLSGPHGQFRPAELINEAYIKFKSGPSIIFQSRSHFFATAATIMRRVLIDSSRRLAKAKRSGAAILIDLNEEGVISSNDFEEVLALAEALERMKATDPRFSKIVELRYFADLSFDEIAKILSLSKPTVMKEWSYAKAWLKRELSSEE